MKMLLSALLICLIHSAIGVPPKWSPSCGKSKYSDAGEYELPTPFIRGGIEAKPHEFPWQVRLDIRTDEKSYLCGGSIINDRWILTAAHCVTHNLNNLNTLINRKDLTLYIGDHKLSEINNPNRQIAFAEKIFLHPKYILKTKNDSIYEISHDFALVKTNQSIHLNENVCPICAPEPDNLYEYRKVAVSGWGLTESAEKPSNILLYTTMNTTTNDNCPWLINPKITKDMICATDNMNDKERSFCEGDSGGPMAVKDSTGIFSIIGLVSFGPKDCILGTWSVFSRVNYVLDWINETIEK